MTHTMRGSIGTLRAAMNGPVIGPADPGYDEARRVWNAGIDRYPAVIARCASPTDVAAAVTFAATNGLEITVRGGAHSMSGAAVTDCGLMIDLSQLNRVSVFRLFKTIARAAGLGENLQHPHVLKHTAAMLMVQQGANAFLIRQALGHKSFDSTLAYVNPTDAEASAALARTFSQAF